MGMREVKCVSWSRGALAYTAVSDMEPYAYLMCGRACTIAILKYMIVQQPSQQVEDFGEEIASPQSSGASLGDAPSPALGSPPTALRTLTGLPLSRLPPLSL
jgi:hypothetical protein